MTPDIASRKHLTINQRQGCTGARATLDKEFGKMASKRAATYKSDGLPIQCFDPVQITLSDLSQSRPITTGALDIEFSFLLG
ncbi:hypothetical protein MACH24_08420 [Erythrobacter sp. Dej080120_24]|nr:hypothetical protein MACH24_08420 [Erythrobacter sp. Dej080120_24]